MYQPLGLSNNPFDIQERDAHEWEPMVLVNQKLRFAALFPIPLQG